MALKEFWESDNAKFVLFAVVLILLILLLRGCRGTPTPAPTPTPTPGGQYPCSGEDKYNLNGRWVIDLAGSDASTRFSWGTADGNPPPEMQYIDIVCNSDSSAVMIGPQYNPADGDRSIYVFDNIKQTPAMGNGVYNAAGSATKTTYSNAEIQYYDSTYGSVAANSIDVYLGLIVRLRYRRA